MKAQEQQVEELEKRTVKIPLKEVQLNIIKEITEEKTRLQERLNEVNKREQDIITFTIAMANIEADSLERINLDGNDIVIVKKVIEKKIEEKEEVKKKEILDVKEEKVKENGVTVL